MRIRRNLSRMGSAFFTAQPEAPPAEAVLPPPPPPEVLPLPPPPSPPPALSADVAAEDAVVLAAVPVVVCALNCQWTAHPDAVNPKEWNDDPVGGGWREPRETPGLAYKSVPFVLQQQEVMEVEVEIEGKTQKKQQQQQHVKKRKKAAGKMKQDAADQRGKRMKAKVIKEVVSDDEAANGVWRCKKNDGRKWYCKRPVAVPNTLCEYHFNQRRRSDYQSGAAAPGASSKSAMVKSSASKAAPVKSSASSKAAPVTAAISSKAASSSAPASSKAASTVALSTCKRPRKKKVVDDYYLGGAFYYTDLFGPFRRKQRGNPSSSSNRVEDGSAEAPDEEDGRAKPREQDDDNNEEYTLPISNGKPRAENSERQQIAPANFSYTRARTKRVLAKFRLLKSLP